MLSQSTLESILQHTLFRLFIDFRTVGFDVSTAVFIFLLSAFILAIILAVCRCTRTPSDDSEPDTSPVPDHPTIFHQGLLYTCACLCRLTYSEHTLGRTETNERYIRFTDHIPHVYDRDNGSVRINNPLGQGIAPPNTYFRVVMTYDSRSIWLLKPLDTNATDAEWVIAFRGTHVLPDILSDAMLLYSVATNKGEAFVNAVDSIVKLLTGTVFTANKIGKSTRVHVTGHSLGATYGEAIYRRLCNLKYTGVTLCCFDSPGLPQFFRSEYPLPRQPSPREDDIADCTPRMIMVFGDDNVVNNLSEAPTGVLCYRVGEEALPMPSFSQLLFALGVIRKVFFSSLKSHSMENIIKELHDGKFFSGHRRGKLQLVGDTLRFMYRIKYNFSLLASFGIYRIPSKSSRTIFLDANVSPSPPGTIRRFPSMPTFDSGFLSELTPSSPPAADALSMTDNDEPGRNAIVGGERRGMHPENVGHRASSGGHGDAVSGITINSLLPSLVDAKISASTIGRFSQVLHERRARRSEADNGDEVANGISDFDVMRAVRDEYRPGAICYRVAGHKAIWKLTESPTDMVVGLVASEVADANDVIAAVYYLFSICLFDEEERTHNDAIDDAISPQDCAQQDSRDSQAGSERGRNESVGSQGNDAGSEDAQVDNLDTVSVQDTRSTQSSDRDQHLVHPLLRGVPHPSVFPPLGNTTSVIPAEHSPGSNRPHIVFLSRKKCHHPVGNRESIPASESQYYRLWLLYFPTRVSSPSSEDVFQEVMLFPMQLVILGRRLDQVYFVSPARPNAEARRVFSAFSTVMRWRKFKLAYNDRALGDNVSGKDCLAAYRRVRRAYRDVWNDETGIATKAFDNVILGHPAVLDDVYSSCEHPKDVVFLASKLYEDFVNFQKDVERNEVRIWNNSAPAALQGSRPFSNPHMIPLARLHVSDPVTYGSTETRNWRGWRQWSGGAPRRETNEVVEDGWDDLDSESSLSV